MSQTLKRTWGVGVLANRGNNTNASREIPVTAALVQDPCQEYLTLEQVTWVHLKLNLLSIPVSEQKHLLFYIHF